MRSPLHAAALEYATQRGWAVFPLTPGDKYPLKGTRGHLEATTDPKQIDIWWGHNPDYNIGCAVAPSGLVGLDVDIGVKKDGTSKRGRESLAEIEHELGPTLLATTPSGGTHAIYERPPDVPPARVIGFRDGLDLIGDGYIVLAPSYSAEKKRHYTWAQLHPITPLPPFLQTITRASRTREKVSAAGAPIGEGNRNNALYKLGAALRDTGISREALARALDAENHSRFTPPLPDSEVVQIVNSVMTRVVVKRDVAAGAIVEQAIHDIFAPQRRSQWIEQVALTPLPPMKLYSTTFPDLDKLIGGFSTQQLTGLIAPPSSGKSALIGHWLLELSKRRPVLHVSLELLRRELFVRYAAHRLAFPWKDGLYGKYPQKEMVGAVKGLRIRLMGAEDFDPNNPWGGIEDEMQRMAEENGGVAPILAIDYIQLMARSSTTEMRHRVGQLTMRARQISQRFDTVVLGVFTTQRFSYSGKTGDQLKATEDPTAFLAAAKESGDIEFDCATLMFLDVDKLHSGAVKPARIAVARCRVGDIGFVGLRARLDIGRFESDPSALAEMSIKAREERKQEEEILIDSRKIIEIIVSMPNRGIGELRDAAKLNNARWAKAVAKLERDGAIAKTEQRINGKIVRNGKTLEIRNAVTTPSIFQEEDVDVDPRSS